MRNCELSARACVAISFVRHASVGHDLMRAFMRCASSCGSVRMRTLIVLLVCRIARSFVSRARVGRELMRAFMLCASLRGSVCPACVHEATRSFTISFALF